MYTQQHTPVIRGVFMVDQRAEFGRAQNRGELIANGLAIAVVFAAIAAIVVKLWGAP